MRSINKLSFLYLLTAFTAVALLSCTGDKKEVESVPSLFKVLGENETGLHFANNLQPTESFNMFHYMYYYNGAGVGAGDFNNDGFVDLFFAGNEVPCALYLNQGKLKFKDVKQQLDSLFVASLVTSPSLVLP